jgi:hypothetical protein
MKNRYRLFRRGQVYYTHDAETGKQQSLRTTNRKEAERLLIARNEAQDNRLLNLKIAEAHLAAHDPQMNKRTWQDVMDYMLDRKGEVRASTLERAAIAFRSKPFDLIRRKRLVETVSEDLLRVLKAGSVSTNVWLRVLHNTALKLDWLLRRVLAEAAWPKVRYGTTRAITAEEHEKIIGKERDEERKRFYQTLWHTGAAPVDIANLTQENVNWEKKVLQFFRQKLNGQKEPACVQIGPELEKILLACPEEGFLFPKMHATPDKERSAEFRRRCRTAGVVGVKLYSYRYAWAERAQACGYPERFAMVNLGHSCRAIHRAYAKKARVTCPSLEVYEAGAKNKKIVPFKAEQAA